MRRSIFNRSRWIIESIRRLPGTNLWINTEHRTCENTSRRVHRLHHVLLHVLIQHPRPYVLLFLRVDPRQREAVGPSGLPRAVGTDILNRILLYLPTPRLFKPDGEAVGIEHVGEHANARLRSKGGKERAHQPPLGLRPRLRCPYALLVLDVVKKALIGPVVVVLRAANSLTSAYRLDQLTVGEHNAVLVPHGTSLRPEHDLDVLVGVQFVHDGPQALARQRVTGTDQDTILESAEKAPDREVLLGPGGLGRAPERQLDQVKDGPVKIVEHFVVERGGLVRMPGLEDELVREPVICPKAGDQGLVIVRGLEAHFFFLLPAFDIAIATACFCGFPAFISVFMLLETAFFDFPFFKGMAPSYSLYT